MGREAVRKYVESRHCLNFPGAFMTDFNLGIFTAHLNPVQSLRASSKSALPSDPQGLLTKMIESYAQCITGQMEQPFKRRAQLHEQEDRNSNR